MLVHLHPTTASMHRIARGIAAGVQIIVMGALGFMLSVFCATVVALVLSPILAPAVFVICGWCSIVACRGPHRDHRFLDRPR